VSIGHFYFAQIGHYHFAATDTRETLRTPRPFDSIASHLYLPEHGA
jgi:hypothetical protein